MSGDRAVYAPKPARRPARGRPAHPSAASCTCCARAAVGAVARPSMGRARRCTTGSTAGLGAASGAPCWRRGLKPDGSPNWPHSTAPTCARTARRTAGKEGQGAGHWPVAWRPDHQNPHPHRRPRPPRGRPPHARQCQRRDGRARRARRCAGPPAPPRSRPGLRRRRAGAWAACEGHEAGHPGRRCCKRPIRHDKLAANFASAVALAAVVAFWC